jgi:hypothetical protein
VGEDATLSTEAKGRIAEGGGTHIRLSLFGARTRPPQCDFRKHLVRGVSAYAGESDKKTLTKKSTLPAKKIIVNILSFVLLLRVKFIFQKIKVIHIIFSRNISLHARVQ